MGGQDMEMVPWSWYRGKILVIEQMAGQDMEMILGNERGVCCRVG